MIIHTYIHIPAVSEGCRFDTQNCDVLRGATMAPVSDIKKTHVLIFNIDPKVTQKG